MALIVANRVKENTSTTGVGGITFTGSPNGFQPFSGVMTNGDITYYVIEENDKWEVGIGTFGSNNMTRTTILASSNGGSAISLGGSGIVSLTYPAEKATYLNENDEFVLGASGLLFTNGTVFKEAKLVELTDVLLSGTPTSSTIIDVNVTSKGLSIGDRVGSANSNSVIVGYGAASGTTSGYANVVVGAEAAVNNQTGFKNVHIGNLSGPSDTNAATLVYNAVSVGYQAGSRMRHNSTAIGYLAGHDAYEIGFVAIGAEAGSGIGSYSVGIGYQATHSYSDDYAVGIGYQAGHGGGGGSAVWIGNAAGKSTTAAERSIGIGKSAGQSSTADDAIYIGNSAGKSNTSDDYLFIGNGSPSSNRTLIKGDMQSKRLAIGAADVSLTDTLYVGIASSSDKGLVVKAASSQSADLTQWVTSADAPVAYVSNSGVITANAFFASGQGLKLASATPITTANTLYNVGGDLYFNGSAVSSAVSTADFNYVSGIAVYGSGQAQSLGHASGVAAYASGQATSLNYASGLTATNATNITATTAVANYASGQATSLNYASGLTATNASNISTNTTNITATTSVANYASGQATSLNYASGLTATNASNISTNTTNITATTSVANYASGQATSLNYASGLTATNASNISTNTTNITSTTAVANYASGQATSLNVASGVANYASGQAIENEGDILSLMAASGQAVYASGNTSNIHFGSNAEGDLLYHDGSKFIRLPKGTDSHVLTMDGNVPAWEAATGGGGDVTTAQLEYVSGVAVYGSGQAQSLGYASGVAVYASGQAIENESDIVAVSGISHYASGLAITNETDIVATSGIANYASGQAIANESDIVATSGIASYASGLAISNESDIVATSGIANYASGQAIANESDIVATSGIANYASGQAIANESDIVAVSGIAAYASGHTLQGITDNGAVTTNAISITNNNITASSGLFDSLDMTPLGNGQQPAYQEGVVFYDSENRTLSLYNDEADISLQIGQEQYARVRNNTAATIENGTAVLFNGVHGNAAPTISGAIATSEATSQVIGLATHSIEPNSFGYVTTYGIVRDADTSAFSAGDELYLSATQIGSGVNTSPVIPNFKVTLGHVITSSSSNGSILVQVGNAKLGGGDVKSEGPLNVSGVPFITSTSDTTAGGSLTDPLFIFDSGNRQLQLASGVQLLDGAPTNTSNVLYNEGGTLKFNGSAVDTTYTAGDGLDLSGTEFSTDLKANGGLVIESTEIAVDLSASNITGTLSVGDGGTGSTSASDARTALGVAIGSDVQAWDAELDTLAGLTEARGSLIVGNSTPAWSALAIGSANTVLTSDGTDASWSSSFPDIANYASGQVNVTDGVATASKALVLDSNKSFTGVKDGVFNQYDSWVRSSGIQVGASGIVVQDADLSHAITIKSPDVVSTSYTLPLPSGLGTNGQVLTTDGVQTYWSTVSGGGGGDIEGVTAGSGISGGGTTGTVTVNLDLNGLGPAAIANGDSIVFVDADDSNSGKTESLADLATLFAGDGLTASSSVLAVDPKANGGIVIESAELAVDLGASSITGTLAVGDGGTGQTSYTNGQLLIGNTTGNTLSKSTLTQGSNVTITNGAGTITIAATDTNTTYSAATSSTLGLMKLEDDTEQSVAANAVSATAGRTYGIQFNSSDQAVVNVPWTDTDTTYSVATSSALGLVKLEDDTEQTVAANTVSATAGRTYGVQLNSSDQAVVNVPWTDTNTTYTAGDGLDLSSTEFSVDLKANGGIVIESTEMALDLGASSITGTLAATDGGTGLTSISTLLNSNNNIFKTISVSGQDDVVADSATDTLTLAAGSNVTITTTAASDTVTIAATDTNTTYTAGDGLDLAGTEFSTDLKANGGLVIESTELAVDLGASSITGTLAVGDGGTGQTSYTNGQILIGNTTGNTLAKSTLTEGSNITITNGAGSITIAATDTNTTYTAGDGLDLSGTEFSTDLKANGGLVIETTELAVDLGASSITGTLAVGDGGTGATSAADARTNLGLGTAAVLDTGISNTNVPKFTTGVADDDFLRVNGTAIEGRSASEVISDISAVGGRGNGAAGNVAIWSDANDITDDPNQLFWDTSSNELGIGTGTPGSTLDISGSVGYKPFTISTASGEGDTDWTTIGANTYEIGSAVTYLVETGNTDRTIELPDPASSIAGRTYTIKKIDSGTGTVTIQPYSAASEPSNGYIDGDNSTVDEGTNILWAQYDTISATCAEGTTSDQYEWHIVQEKVAAHTARIDLAGAMTVATGTATQVTFDTLRWAVGAGTTITGGTRKVTINRKGEYYISFQVAFSNTFDLGEKCFIQLYKNGSVVQWSSTEFSPSTNNYIYGWLNTSLSLDVDDYIQIYLEQSSGETATIYNEAEDPSSNTYWNPFLIVSEVSK